ncbi:LysR family transcriptional regulator [Paracoccus pacificus]|uniref:LysR family transcriptional regulator n=1 Tax=Paracoccus pacificus TaxID=1463598 RepID=A0ABW4R3Q9_9RHOB
MTGLPFVWDDLQYFLAVARTGQLTRASQQLRTSHVTVARRVERLEMALNCRLFERNPRGYGTTPAGEQLRALAERIEKSATDLREELAGTAAAVSGVIRFNVPEGFCDLFCRQFLPEFRRKLPGLSLELVSIQQIMALSRKSSDIGISLDPPKSTPYRVEKLTDYTLHLYASRSYLAQAAPIRSRDDLTAHPFIGYIDDMIFAPALDYLSEVNPRIRPTMESSSIFAQMTAVRQGLGLGILPHYMASTRPDLVQLLPDEVHLVRTYWLSCHRDQRDAPRERTAIGLLYDLVEARQDMLIAR